jgi:hypothetical protein
MPTLAQANDCGTATNDWIAAMRSGRFERAWAIADADLEAVRRSGGDKHLGPRHLQRIWRGEPLAGRRVLVRCYHGLGDTIQFARFLRPLRAIARQVIVWCQPELMPLIRGVDHVLPLHDGNPDTEFDVDIEIMEIPHAIRATPDHFSMRQPYIAARSGGLSGLADRSKLSVGLLWSGGNWDDRRSIPPKLLSELNFGDVRLYSVQRGAASSAATEIGATDISTPDIEDLAARLMALDLCICPDTMVAHLSAALGRETWILLHADCDWRWSVSGCKTYWYPSARLFRQRSPGDWSAVLENVRTALLKRTALRQSVMNIGLRTAT